GQLVAAADGVGRAAAEAAAAERKVLSAGDVGVGGDVVVVVKQHAGTDVEPVAKRSDVHQGLGRTVVQHAVILDAVGLEALAEAHSIGANANVGQRREGHADIAAGAEHRKLGYHAEARTENAFPLHGRRGRGWRRVVATGEREGRGGNGK